MMVLGTDCLIQDFKEAGFQVNTGRSPDAVVLGFDTTITYEAIWAACDAVGPAPRFTVSTRIGTVLWKTAAGCRTAVPWPR